MYELPFGKEKKWATSGTSSAILGGWQINGVFAAYSGRPFTLEASDASLNMPGNLQTPDQIKDNVEILGNVGDDGTYFDTSAFARVTDVRFGNVGRNTMRGPGVVNLDMGLFRTFKITRPFEIAVPGGSVQREQHAALRLPNGNVNSSNFGRILETQGDDALGASRQFRFGLRLTF